MLALAFAAFLFLSGCTGSTGYQTCASHTSQSERDFCFYQSAVLRQQPDSCYYITDLGGRETCLEDSNNPDAQARLQTELEGGTQLAYEATAASPASPPQPVPGRPEDPISKCMSIRKLSRDGCVRALAIENNDLESCATIAAGDYRASCISNIALNLKTKAQCSKLQRDSDRQICQYYSQS